MSGKRKYNDRLPRAPLKSNLTSVYSEVFVILVIIEPMNNSLKKVIDYCTENIVSQEKRPLFVGVAGDSGSGKSYLTQLIKRKNL